GTIVSNGYNLSNDAGVVNVNGGTGSLNATGDKVNTAPRLGFLRDNGGPTLTHSLVQGSPALDAGNSSLTTDQRGFIRPVNLPYVANASGGNGSDIGAVEEYGGAISFSSNTNSVGEGGGNATITITRTGGTGAVAAKVTPTDITTSPADYIYAPGTRDTSFNPAGAGADARVFAVAMQPDGKIVIGGEFTSYNGATTSRGVMRLNADGTPDASFNAGGAGADAFVVAVAVQPDGKILVGGGFTSYNGGAATTQRIMRLNPDGTPDATFNAGGAGANGVVRAVAIQP